ncbi:alpha/beta-hydrolase family protein [Kineosporia sp. J2-2]|uniref:Alpha/beta-hydrolase family protein n=1 Tax=Kineosporia corallincola TaxID=2835133 RepID=A0ABS5TE25_9ACTN|nr:alpha/beta-hydrolase family protein [Kineosporia corallincola]MBT0769300.1 alpha/beta-hydrolase family protein [Kineosporia corallincola]
MIGRVLAVLAGVLVVFGVGGWGSTVDDESPGHPAAEAAVRALVNGGEVVLPSGFETVRSYRPEVVRLPSGDLRAVAPHGGCTSPIGGSPYGFSDACREHDLGYDLLRFAQTQGQPLGPWARRAIDAEFARQMRAGCDGPGCRATAGLYSGAVRLNSWRQGQGVPAPESPVALAGPVLAGVLVGAGLLLAQGRHSGSHWKFARTRWKFARSRDPRRRPVNPLTHWPTVSATGLLALVLPPRMLPHPLPVDIAVGALTLLLGHGAAVAAGRLLSRVRPAPPRPARAPIARAPIALAPAVLALTVLRTQHRGTLLTGRLGEPAPPAWQAFAAVGGAVLLATSIALLAVGLHRMSRRIPRRRLILTASLPVLVWALASARPVPAGAGALATKRAEFLAGARSAAQIGAVTGRPAVAPHRVYVTRDEARNASARADLAVAETERAGGLGSAAVLIVVPTGSGWVNGRVVGTLEQLYDGDLTTVAVQYSATPSWLAYLRGGDGVRESAAALIHAARERIDRLPPQHRPDLLVYGESLGAWGALPSLTGPAGPATDDVDAALLTGVPRGLSVTGPGRATFNHPDDPVPDWTLRPSPVAFLRITADVIAAENAPAGHGHRYGRETATAWCELLRLHSCSPS